MNEMLINAWQQSQHDQCLHRERGVMGLRAEGKVHVREPARGAQSARRPLPGQREPQLPLPSSLWGETGQVHLPSGKICGLH